MSIKKGDDEVIVFPFSSPYFTLLSEILHICPDAAIETHAPRPQHENRIN